MLLFWRIRYFDRLERQFKDRDLFLDTMSLEISDRLAVELLCDTSRLTNQREWLKFKGLFREERSDDSSPDRLRSAGKMKSFCLIDYLEDESGQEISLADLGPLLTGNPKSTLLPSGMRQHDIDYHLAEKVPLPRYRSELEITLEDIRYIGYFVRDFEELASSSFLVEGPGTITSGGIGGDYLVETAVDEEELRSFLTIFRRLYMKNEPANFCKTADLFDKVLRGHPLGKWVKGVAGAFKLQLEATPDFCRRESRCCATFSIKRLIDVFLYTRFAHQPNERRERQFRECLEQVGGRNNLLFGVFLNELWKCGLEIRSGGIVIATWFDQFRELNEITGESNSIRAEYIGLGAMEKRQAQFNRLFQEKVNELTQSLWEDAGRPIEGPSRFRVIAEERIRAAFGPEN